jgi:hypothetical protein
MHSYAPGKEYIEIIAPECGTFSNMICALNPIANEIDTLEVKGVNLTS